MRLKILTDVMHFTATDHLGSTRVVYRRRSILDDVGRPITMAVSKDSLRVVTHTVEHRTGYYASGLPVDYGDATVTDRLHIGNEWLNTGGLGYYNNTARLHAPVLGRFHVPDSYAGSYQWLSPYAHCAANPINLIDPTGRKVNYITEDGKSYELEFNWFKWKAYLSGYGEYTDNNIECLLTDINDLASKPIGAILILDLIYHRDTLNIKSGATFSFRRSDLTVSYGCDKVALTELTENGYIYISNHKPIFR